jgi:DNA repair exonuclease SbcCD ATPase subunit
LYLQEQQLASVKKLSRAEEQLSAVKAQRPGSTVSQKAAMQQRLQEATQEVQAAAAAAQKASQQLEVVAAEKDKVQQELQAIRQQLESAPLAKQHADLYSKLVVSWATPAACYHFCLLTRLRSSHTRALAKQHADMYSKLVASRIRTLQYNTLHAPLDQG